MGTHPIRAVYSGDADDAGSTSPSVNQVVLPVTGAAPVPDAIPTLSEWSMLIMIALVALLGFRRLRARRR